MLVAKWSGYSADAEYSAAPPPVGTGSWVVEHDSLSHANATVYWPIKVGASIKPISYQKYSYAKTTSHNQLYISGFINIINTTALNKNVAFATRKTSAGYQRVGFTTDFKPWVDDISTTGSTTTLTSPSIAGTALPVGIYRYEIYLGPTETRFKIWTTAGSKSLPNTAAPDYNLVKTGSYGTAEYIWHGFGAWVNENTLENYWTSSSWQIAIDQVLFDDTDYPSAADYRSELPIELADGSLPSGFIDLAVGDYLYAPSTDVNRTNWKYAPEGATNAQVYATSSKTIGGKNTLAITSSARGASFMNLADPYEIGATRQYVYVENAIANDITLGLIVRDNSWSSLQTWGVRANGSLWVSSPNSSFTYPAGSSVTSPAATFPVNQWVRVESSIAPTGTISMKIWMETGAGHHSVGSPDYTLTNTLSLTDLNQYAYWIGPTNLTGPITTGSNKVYVGGFGVASKTLLGPVAGSSTVSAAVSSTSTESTAVTANAGSATVTASVTSASTESITISVSTAFQRTVSSPITETATVSASSGAAGTYPRLVTSALTESTVVAATIVAPPLDSFYPTTTRTHASLTNYDSPADVYKGGPAILSTLKTEVESISNDLVGARQEGTGYSTMRLASQAMWAAISGKADTSHTHAEYADAAHTHPGGGSGWRDELVATDYGVKADCVNFLVNVTNGVATITATTPVFTSTLVDGGKVLHIDKASAGGTNTWHKTTIASVTNSTTAVLSSAPTRTISGANAVMGTDNTASINSLINTAGANSTIVFPRGTYFTNGNHQITAGRVVVLGEGINATSFVTTHLTDSVWVVKSTWVDFEDFGITHAALWTPEQGHVISFSANDMATFPTAGAGIQLDNANGWSGVNITRVSSAGMYVGFEAKRGSGFFMYRSVGWDCVRACVRLRNELDPDDGNFKVNECHFGGGNTYVGGTAYGIEWNGGGGTWIEGNHFNRVYIAILVNQQISNGKAFSTNIRIADNSVEDWYSDNEFWNPNMFTAASVFGSGALVWRPDATCWMHAIVIAQNIFNSVLSTAAPIRFHWDTGTLAVRACSINGNVTNNSGAAAYVQKTGTGQFTTTSIVGNVGVSPQTSGATGATVL
jgi:hypothetical protein